jgi:sporulation protein YlmC with PRC-barrel domain
MRTTTTLETTDQKRVQTFEIEYSKIQKIKEISVLTLFCVIHY